MGPRTEKNIREKGRDVKRTIPEEIEQKKWISSVLRQGSFDPLMKVSVSYILMSYL